MYAMPGKNLFRWQEECLDRWFENGCRGVAGVATGAGKTLLALAAAYNLAAHNPSVSLKIKVIVPTVFLANQWRGDIMRELGVLRRDIGMYYGSVKEPHTRAYTIYVLNTARGCAARHILKDISEGCSVFLICDECHHFGSAENARVFDFLPHIPLGRCFTLGLSATPECEHFDDVVVPALGEEIYRYGISEASNDSITAKYRIYNIDIKFTPDEADEYGELSDYITMVRARLFARYPQIAGYGSVQYFAHLNKLCRLDDETGKLARNLSALYRQRKETLHLAKARPDCAFELVKRLFGSRRIIVFSERIESADSLYLRLNKEFPGKICRYHSKMDFEVKQRALERYRAGEASVIVCCRALDEGLNVPETDAGIIMSASSADRQRLQRMGRVLRRGTGDMLKSLYYLRIPGTSEPTELLSDGISGGGTVNLRYDTGKKRFENDEYDTLAEYVRNDLRSSGATERQLDTLEKQLERGVVRADFMLPVSSCRERLEAAERVERDYWITALRMAKARHHLGSVR